MIYDKVTDFEIRDRDGLLVYGGKLQNRVVRSAITGTLHFYYRIRDTDPDGYGYLEAANTLDFAPFVTDDHHVGRPLTACRCASQIV